MLQIHGLKLQYPGDQEHLRESSEDERPSGRWQGQDPARGSSSKPITQVHMQVRKRAHRVNKQEPFVV